MSEKGEMRGEVKKEGEVEIGEGGRTETLGVVGRH